MGKTQLTTDEIGDQEVKLVDLVNATTNNRLLGRATAGAGSFEEIIVGTNLSFTGTTLNASGSSSEITGKLNSDANSTYTDNSSYWSKVITTDGWVVNGILTGTRKGTENTQRLQDVTTGDTYARVWLNGSTAWTTWSKYVDAQDYTAKGQFQVSSASNTVSNLTVGTDGNVLIADSTQTLGVRWISPMGKIIATQRGFACQS